MTKASQNSSTHVQVPITADVSGLSADDHRVMLLLVEAAKLVDVIYLHQSRQADKAPDVSFDMSLPKAFYPMGTTTADIEAYLDECPDDRESILSPFTVVEETEGGHYYATPYSVHYEPEMEQVAELLFEAAELVAEPAFSRFLYLRGEAFLTNQYRVSDIAWIYANNGPFEFTVGPYESYADKLFGVKRTFESILGVVLKPETEMAVSFQKHVSTFDAFLGARYGYATTTTLTPMVVMDEIYASGEALYEYVPMAYNLPNDRDIHAEVGSKKVFIRNVMLAKFEQMSRVIAKRVLREEDAEQFDFETYLQFVIGHESAHGLSFHFDGSVFGPVASAIEECKADVFGMWFLYYLADQGVLDTNTAELAVMQNLTDGLRQIRFGAEEAHAVGTIVQLNWFVEAGALLLTERGFDFDPTNFREAITTLGDELYKLASDKQQSEVETFIAQWGKQIPEAIKNLLPRFADIPVDIDPIFSF